MRHYLLSILFWIAPLLAQHTCADEEQLYLNAYITAPYVELHTGPGRGYPVFYVAERDEAVTLLKQRTRWVKVRTQNGKEGWVTQEMFCTIIRLKRVSQKRLTRTASASATSYRSLPLTVSATGSWDLWQVILAVAIH